MRKKPLLAMAALAALAAGCTVIPSVPGTDQTLRVPVSTAPNVKLHTQGLLKAALTAAQVDSTLVGAVLSSTTLAGHLAHLVPLSDDVPDETLSLLVKEEPATDALPLRYVIVGTTDEATHRLYQLDHVKPEDRERLSVELGQGASAESTPATFTVDAHGALRVAFPTPDPTYWVRLLAPETHTIRFLHPLGGSAYEARLDLPRSAWEPNRDFRLTADVALKDANGKPLPGLKRENFRFGLSATLQGVTYPGSAFGMTLSVSESQPGTYRFVALLKDVALVEPSGYAIDLAIQNAPLIHDVPYDAVDEEK